ncbi:hypothetical protein Q8A73_020413 [Channa argus]|nr:hypothetical protein Q8A73_020413 [Channa argus]
MVLDTQHQKFDVILSKLVHGWQTAWHPVIGSDKPVTALEASSLQTLGAVIARHPVMSVTLSQYDKCWTANTLPGKLAIFLQDCPVLGVMTNTEKSGKNEDLDVTRSVSSASAHLHHCHISWSQGCEVI